jgi:cytochrome c551/c552
MKKMNIKKISLLAVESLAVVIVGLSLTLSFARGATAADPGVRGGAAGAGGPVAGLNPNESLLFTESILRVTEIEATCDTCNQSPQGIAGPPGITNSGGLGGVFNADQCVICHSQPSLGGSSPAQNPAFISAARRGGTNVMPPFETPNGPMREVRFKFNSDLSRDGGVHSLFTPKGRADAPLCNASQPDFNTAVAQQNIAFRIPLQLFGLGLIESISDTTLTANLAANASQKQALGITGHFNRVPNNGTISRFGWKAQNGSVTTFAGEAYNVEMGISNDLFPISRSEDPNCNLGNAPNDVPRTDERYNDPLKIMPAWIMFTEFMRFLDAPKPIALTASAQRGQVLFSQVGCAFCHTPSMTIRSGPLGPATVALQGKTANLYSDLALHNMGSTLADNITQGGAGPDEFRTTPLWGLGQRIFFLHDGRTTDLNVAIQDHFSSAFSFGGDNPEKDILSFLYQPSEANGTVNAFNGLSNNDKQAIFDFLRSL